jgi:hypothetical protein
MPVNCIPRRAFALFFTLVWFINGLGCKVLDLVPRHRAIVGRILGEPHALALTRAIGLSELVMAAWIATQWKWRWSTTAQIVVVITMNVIEFLLAPDLLLFGHWNALIALTYAGIVAYSGFIQVVPQGSPQA